MAASQDIVDQLCSRFGTLKSNRVNIENHWQELAEYCLPRKSDITVKKSKGTKRQERVFDGTAIHATEVLAAALHGMLTGQSSRWFDVGIAYPLALREDEEVLAWLEKVADAIYYELGRSNFDTELHELYLDIVTFGTSCMFIEYEDGELRFSTRHIAEVFIAENKHGRIDTIFRLYKCTVRQAVQRFGLSSLSERLKKLFEKTPDTEVELLHVVMPRRDRVEGALNSENMPIASLYIDVMEKKLILEMGYQEEPAVCPRWVKAANEEYGRSPAMTALPDIKTLNRMSELMLKAAAKIVDPPILVEDESVVGDWVLAPGKLLKYRSGYSKPEALAPGANIPLGLELEERRRNTIMKAFYTDLLQFSDGPQMTAEEVRARLQQQLRLLGPVLGRLTAELLSPMLQRVFKLLLRNRRIPPPPRQLGSVDFKLEYQSPLARAQRRERLDGLVQALNILMPLQQVLPVMDNLNGDKVVKEVTTELAVSRDVLNTEADKKKIRSARAETQAQANQLASAQQGAAAAKDLSKAGKDANVDVGQMVGG